MNCVCTAADFYLSCFDSLTIAGETVAAATALAGLIIVYLGNLHSAYTHLRPQTQEHVRRQFRRRARLAFGGVVIALFAAFLGVIGKSLHSEVFADISTIILFAAFIWGGWIALMTSREVTSVDS